MASLAAAAAAAVESLDPPSSSCLEILNEYLKASVVVENQDEIIVNADADGESAAATTTAVDTAAASKNKSKQQQDEQERRQDEVLRLVDFLYGSTTVEGALAILDNNAMVRDNTIITRVISQSSQRSLFLVKAAAASASHKRRKLPLPQHQHHYQQQCNDDSNYYLCLLPPHDDAENHQDEPLTAAAFLPVYYCSCRSFLEKNSRYNGCTTTSSRRDGTWSNNSNHSHSPNLCKHLLALRLMPALQICAAAAVTTTETVSDYDFSEIILNRLLPPSSTHW
jgi:hypothetical protein